MNQDLYKIEKADATRIHIRDLATGVGFSFVIKDRKLGRPSIAQRPLPSSIAQKRLDDPSIVERATSFALQVARARDLVGPRPVNN